MSRSLLALGLLLFSAQPLLASPLQAPLISGQLKTLNLAYQKTDSQESGLLSANSLRFDLKGQLNDALELEFALNNQLLYSDPADPVGPETESPNRRVDLEKSWQRGEHWSTQASVDRLALKGSFGNFDWQLGRQAIGFGRISLFSPLDVVAPFAPEALDTDIRPGVDALRGVHYFGLGGQLGGTIVLGDKAEHNSYLMTFSANRLGIDLLGIGGILRERELFGLGLAGNLGPLGIKAEISHYNSKENTLAGDLRDEFNIAALEFWYRFENGMILLAEYLHNGAGADNPEDYAASASAATFREGLSFLLGRKYLLLGPSWELHPLATISGLLIRNLTDDSSLLRPQLQLSLSDNLSLDLFYSLNFGQKPQKLTPAMSLPKSEFGSTADSGGLLLRYYF
jgi:hypothetical protein